MSVFNDLRPFFSNLRVWDEFQLDNTLRMLRFQIESARLVELTGVRDMELRYIHYMKTAYNVFIPVSRVEQWIFKESRLVK